MASPSYSRWLRFLLAAYYPFLLLLLAFLAWVTFVLVRFTVTVQFAWWFTALPLAWVGLTILQLLQVVPVWFMQPLGAGVEIRLPAAFLEPIYQFIAPIVRERKLRMPHDVRLSPDTAAHVYEDGDGQRILVLGGLLVSSFTQTALAGVVAHELGHFAAGDTGTTRQAAQRGQTMACLEALCQGRASMFFNPVIWLIRLYHLAFQLAFLANSQQQEFAADEQFLQQVGNEEAAATLLFLDALECLPSLRLANIAKDFAARQEPLAGIFVEQQRRALALDGADWEEAYKKALKKKTTRWSTHPALRDRLKAFGVSGKQAAQLLQERQSGPLARELFPAWEGLEKLMSEQWLHAARIEQQVKQELAQIFIGRPR